MGEKFDKWLQETRKRLRSELSELYFADDDQGESGPHDAATQQRIARILRAFHLIETREYGSCAACGAAIPRGLLIDDPTRDICDNCTPGISNPENGE
ncbi:MAG: hypothetical protein K2Y27_13735 [Xanthobacteraceae bacterium]|nr:hypothetical protein [Xanthobacteraceae bacterium]